MELVVIGSPVAGMLLCNEGIKLAVGGSNDGNVFNRGAIVRLAPVTTVTCPCEFPKETEIPDAGDIGHTSIVLLVQLLVASLPPLRLV